MTLHERAAFRHLDRVKIRMAAGKVLGPCFLAFAIANPGRKRIFRYGDNRSMQLRRRVQTL